jgi:hypothetical protein
MGRIASPPTDAEGERDRREHGPNERVAAMKSSE